MVVMVVMIAMMIIRARGAFLAVSAHYFVGRVDSNQSKFSTLNFQLNIDYLMGDCANGKHRWHEALVNNNRNTVRFPARPANLNYVKLP